VTNQLIFNLKKSVERRGHTDWIWKERAIRRAATTLLNSLNPAFLATSTFIPVPPSRVSNDPLYDDRMSQVLRLLGPQVDVRELVLQVQSTEGAHVAVDRPGPKELYDNYVVDADSIAPTPAQIAIVDDVLTTGAHFKAMKRILNETFPYVGVVGLFLARRVPNTE
jgi:predicted amidophosphoribosyltransferase